MLYNQPTGYVAIVYDNRIIFNTTCVNAKR